MSKVPDPAVLEIVERTPRYDPEETGVGALIKPNEIRLNGVPLLASREDPVVVHEMSTNSDDIVRATITLLVRRVSITQEARD